MITYLTTNKRKKITGYSSFLLILLLLSAPLHLNRFVHLKDDEVVTYLWSKPTAGNRVRIEELLIRELVVCHLTLDIGHSLSESVGC